MRVQDDDGADAALFHQDRRLLDRGLQWAGQKVSRHQFADLLARQVNIYLKLVVAGQKVQLVVSRFANRFKVAGQ